MSKNYSEIAIRKLEAMRVASYRIISKNPESEVIGYMNSWIMENELNKQENVRNFGFDVPVNEQQKQAGLRGYEYWATVPDTAIESNGIKIKNIEEDEYAVLRITNPFNNPFETIPEGWRKLNEWVMNGEYKTTNYNSRYWLEEVIHTDKDTYMDIYFPVKDGGRKCNAQIAKLSVTELNSFRLIGKEIRCTMGHPEGNPIPAFWEKCFEEGILKNLEDHPDRIYRNACIGWMGKFNTTDNTFSYVVGVLTRPDACVPEGMNSIDIQDSRYAVGTIQGTEPDIYMNAHSFTELEMKKRGLKFNTDLEFEMEWYDQRFCQNEGYKVIDLYIPIQ